MCSTYCTCLRSAFKPQPANKITCRVVLFLLTIRTTASASPIIFLPASARQRSDPSLTAVSAHDPLTIRTPTSHLLQSPSSRHATHDSSKPDTTRDHAPYSFLPAQALHASHVQSTRLECFWSRFGQRHSFQSSCSSLEVGGVSMRFQAVRSACSTADVEQAAGK